MYGEADDAPNQCLLGWKVVVQGGDVDADVAGDVAGAEALETVARDAAVRGGNQGATPVDLATTARRVLVGRHINHLISRVAAAGRRVKQLIDGGGYLSRRHCRVAESPIDAA